jgi:hypothetical protein
LQATHQGQVEIYPENEQQYFAKTAGAQVTFETDSDGQAKGLILRQDGREMHGERLDETAATAIAKELAVINDRGIEDTQK